MIGKKGELFDLSQLFQYISVVSFERDHTICETLIPKLEFEIYLFPKRTNMDFKMIENSHVNNFI